MDKMDNTDKTKGYDYALGLVESRLAELRADVPRRFFDPAKPAEIEINKFWFDGRTIDRIMVVLRSTGCEHYKDKKGCSMCAHYDGTTENPVKAVEYMQQWKSVVSGKALERHAGDFDINDYPVLCLYNLGSFLNPNEIPPSAARGMFKSIGSLKGIEKTIIESRAEYVIRESLENIRAVNNGLIEVGMGLESSDFTIRELCHHKNLPELSVFEEAIDLLHEYGFKALAYINLKPVFLTERESVEDAVSTSLYALRHGIDAISIEPTSLQNHSLTDLLSNIGLYRVPWLWSVRQVVEGIYREAPDSRLDIRLGGYFDEEILSGSQGASPGVERNELFPHTTSGNCSKCTPRMVEAIKEFNRTYDPQVLYREPPCDECYPVWEASMAVRDSRSIPQRIIDTLER
jgi:archaeosine synthase beta-subunit